MMTATISSSTMKEQVAVLEEQRIELLSINRKWAEQYHSMIQFYEEKVNGLKALLAQHHLHLQAEDDLMPQTREQTEETHIKERRSNPELLTTTRQEEVQRLREQNSSLIRRGQRQHEEIKRLNKALEENFQFSGTPKVGSETQERLWKHQAEVYKEDFLKERRDREKLKEKHLELERRFRKVHSELQALKSPLGSCGCRS